MSAIDELLARHRAFSVARASHEVGEALAPRPRLRVAVLTCMDARIDITAALGLRPGDVHVLRNAGGLVTDDALRSLVVSQRLLGTTEVMVVMHTDCGLAGLRNADLARRVAAEAGVDVPFAFGGFADLDAELRRSIETLRTCPWLLHRDVVRSFVYDVATHRIDERVGADADLTP
jgi:carbonic anhydrase